MFKVLEETKWDDIKIGEVFALKGCWQIGYKIDDDKLMCLATTDDVFVDYIGQNLCFVGVKYDTTILFVKEAMLRAGDNGQLYKLPLEVQNLYITN